MSLSATAIVCRNLLVVDDFVRRTESLARSRVATLAREALSVGGREEGQQRSS